MAEEKNAARFYVDGRVQGVSFRFFVRENADRLHLTGFVRNLSDGRLEAQAYGSEASLQKLEKLLHKGPRMAKIDSVEREDLEGDELEHIQSREGFEIMLS